MSRNWAPTTLSLPANAGLFMIASAMRRAIYVMTLRKLSLALAMAAIIGGLIYADRLYFLYAICLQGAGFALWGWLAYLRTTGLRLPAWRASRARPRVPYSLRRFKNQPLGHRPAFMRDFRDFDDDLNAVTTIDETAFSPPVRARIAMWTNFLCAILLLLFSIWKP
jgi:hypothetical protein